MKPTQNFPLPLKVEFLDGKRWKVFEPFVYRSAKYGVRTIQADTIFDFGSIPPKLHGLISPTCVGKSFLVHDDAYERGDLTREQADDLFWECMAVESREQTEARKSAIAARSGFIPEKGTGLIRRWIIWRAVRRFGFIAWRQHRQRDGELKLHGQTLAALSLLMLCALLCGCKITGAKHQWPDRSVTTVYDGRLFHKQEAAFNFHRDTNGTVSVSAAIQSGADADAIREAFDAGLKLGKKAAGVP